MKIHCKRGHLRIPENVYKNGYCKLCAKDQAIGWRERNPEKDKLYRKKYRTTEAHLERDRKRSARRFKEHPEKYKARRARRRAYVNGSEGSFSGEEWFLLCFAVGFKCLCCKKNKTLTPDHIIPVSRGGTSWLWNIQPLCLRCNQRKGTKIIDYRGDSE